MPKNAHTRLAAFCASEPAQPAEPAQPIEPAQAAAAACAVVGVEGSPTDGEALSGQSADCAAAALATECAVAAALRQWVVACLRYDTASDEARLHIEQGTCSPAMQVCPSK